MTTKGESRIIASKCKLLVSDYSEVFNVIATELVDEMMTTINLPTAEGIALEYMKREGMKMGIKEFLRRIHTKAAKND